MPGAWRNEQSHEATPCETHKYIHIYNKVFVKEHLNWRYLVMNFQNEKAPFP